MTIKKKNKGFAGLLAMGLIFMIIIGVNTATLYSLFFEFCTLTEVQFSSSQVYRYIDFGMTRGIWLVKNSYQPSPYNTNYSEVLSVPTSAGTVS